SFFFSSRRRHTRFDCDWSSDVCSSDLGGGAAYKPTDYTQSLDPTGLRGARIGVARKFFGFNDQVDKLMADAIDLMKREGATVVDPADLATHGKIDAPEFDVLLFEFKTDLNKYLASLPPGDHPRTLKDLIDFNDKNKD